jgi:hypothetical protein
MCARQTLEKVRTLYMSAMTIPNILQFPPHLMAYQLTLIESSIFRAIPSQALTSHSTRTPHKKIVASTDFFNFMTRSIEHSILLPQEATKRAEIIHRWIKIATKLLALNNYQTLKAIISALGTPPIQRLRRTWECIPKKRMGRLDLLNTLMSESDNYRKYREHIQNLWSKPVVPFLGVFILDVTYLSAACSKNTLRVQEILNDVQMFQRAPPYPPIPPASLAPAKKHSFLRPSSVLHFGSSSNSAKNSNRNTTAALMGEDQRQDTELELEQQLIVQYILMRPWVSEKTIDALSTLREPAKPRSISSPTTSASSTTTSATTGYHASPTANTSTSRPSSGFMSTPTASSTTIINGSNISVNNSSSLTPMTPITINTSPSVLNSNNGGGGSSFKSSYGSSFMRFNSNNSQSNEISPTNTTHAHHITATTPTEESKRSYGGFWPFKKNSSSSSNTAAANPNSSSTAITSTEVLLSIPQEQNWSEEEDDDDDEEEDVIGASRFGHLLHHSKSNNDSSTSSSKMNNGHSRSISLPANKYTLINDDVYAK